MLKKKEVWKEMEILRKDTMCMISSHLKRCKTLLGFHKREKSHRSPCEAWKPQTLEKKIDENFPSFSCHMWWNSQHSRLFHKRKNELHTRHAIIAPNSRKVFFAMHDKNRFKTSISNFNSHPRSIWLDSTTRAQPNEKKNRSCIIFFSLQFCPLHVEEMQKKN